MAIEFECPNCGERYRLRDDVAGKKAKCKNPQCGKMMLIPQPRAVTVPPTTPPPDHEIEAAAHTHLTEQPPAAEAAPEVQDIPLNCPACDHKWAVPRSMAGKNVVCPECSHRLKVPVPKKDAPTDWRQGGNTGKPSLAKENFEKPKDVVSSEGQVVSREAWQKGGGAEQELEPIPLKRRLMVIVPALLLVGGVVWGAVYLWNIRTTGLEHQLFDEARKEFADGADAGPGEAPLLSAILNLAEAEHDLRLNKNQPKKEELDHALNHVSKARADLNLTDVKDAAQRSQVTPERNAIACELALFTLDFGGTDDQVTGQTRIRWDPNQLVKKKAVGDKVAMTVHEELRLTLALVKSAEFDLKAALARRLTRELVKRGQVGIVEALPGMLCDAPAEKDEVRALVALELYRLNVAGSRPKEISDELARQYSGKQAPQAPFVLGLWVTVPPTGVKGAPAVPAFPPGSVSEPTRIAYTCQLLLQDKPAEAFNLANRPGEGRVRALLLCAEWSADPIPALEAARPTLTVGKGSQATAPLQAATYRFVQLAGAAGRPDVANGFADTITDEGLRAWARGEAVRLRMTPENAQPADESWAEVPDDPKKVRAGQAWGRLWVARQNARVSGDRAREKKAISGWPNVTVHPFGLAGIALGLQDRELR
jgi:hypothetical protein